MALLLLVLASAYIVVIYPDSDGPGAGEMVFVDIPWGGGAFSTGERAEDAGVVDNDLIFAIYLRLSGHARTLNAGRHRVDDSWSPAQVAQELCAPGLRQDVRFTVREGWTRFDIARALDAAGVTEEQAFLETTGDGAHVERFGIVAASAEGYLYPETYRFEPGTDPAVVADRLVDTFQERVAPLLEAKADELRRLEQGLAALEAQLAARREKRGQPGAARQIPALHGAVTLASIVEAETPHADERPTVAAVFLNRLFSPAFPFRRLQADPTVRYGCVAEPERATSCAGDPSRPLTRAQLDDRQNRYSTYTNPSLPPGPIGNPSLSSLQAVLTPERSDMLYFVATGRGRHTFSRTLEAHNAAVARYRERTR